MLKAMKALRFRRMWEVAGPVLQADIARRTVAHMVQRLPPEGQEPDTNTATVQVPALRHASPPRAAPKRTLDERSPQGSAVGQSQTPLIEDTAAERRLPPRRLTYASAAAAEFRQQYQREVRERGEGVPTWGDAWAVGKFQCGR